MKEETKKKFKRILPFVGAGVLAIGAGIVGYEIGKKDKYDAKQVDGILNLTKAQARADHLVDMANFCIQNGESVVGSYSSKGPGQENAEYWLIAKVVDKIPEGLHDEYLEDVEESGLRDAVYKM